ncbi:antibiotic ABC transporter ATP-binding protein [Kribbella sp. ALI-6-A]|uniref:ATP-binding cassette domain-containing protein n=1 Tax=Kribbella sp. ALI-6-A TaxID=1933817 RepID=UPI00097C3FB8|nr:ABC transporter ATP-binding protein [Kribbella sp. ALI-6-A]ONI76721.1 antibiotic ABC transporter ATP-binding protein [Kribbella sp. ALI-6-A]
MKRELRFAVTAVRRRPAVQLAAWSVPEILPTACYGLAVAHAADAFLSGRVETGLAWLGGLLAAAVLGAIGARQVYRRLGELVEPVRDELVGKVVAGALGNARADGAVARLNRQVEIVRDTFAGLVLVVRSFVVTVIGVVTGLLSLDPLVAALVVPPFLLGFLLSLGVLGLAADRVRASLRADEDLATAAGMVFAGVRDVNATGAEGFAARLVGVPIAAQAAAERSLAKVAALRTLCFAVGGWVPLVVLLAAAPWLTGRGVSTGTLLGGMTYVLLGLQPALNTVMSALGDSGLRYVVTLGRILDMSKVPERRALGRMPTGHHVRLRRVCFAYGPGAAPVLHDLDLVVRDGDHLAVVGPSGIGKSTLAGVICGLLPPTDGKVLLGGVPPSSLQPSDLAGTRVLIPQEAYVFTGTVLDNLTYLRPAATQAQVRAATEAVGAARLVDRLGGLEAPVSPSELSAGERQLLALARAYLSPAPLAVLDEATCHLDPEAERIAEEAFARRPGSLVVIAHRISSALRAQRILVLDGSHATIGTHQSLLATSPLYADLVGHWTGTDEGAAQPADDEFQRPSAQSQPAS